MGNNNEAEALFATKRKQQQEQEAERARLEELERQKQEMADTIKKLELMKAEQEKEKREKEEREARERQEREERERIEREERQKKEAKEARSAERKAAVDTTIKAASEKVDKAVTNITSKNYLLYGIVGFAAVLVIVVVILLIVKSGGSSDDKNVNTDKNITADKNTTADIEDVNAKTTDDVPDDGSFASKIASEEWIRTEDPYERAFSYIRPMCFDLNEEGIMWVYNPAPNHRVGMMIDYYTEEEAVEDGVMVSAEEMADMYMSVMDAGDYRFESFEDGSGYAYSTNYDDIGELQSGSMLAAYFVKCKNGGYVTMSFMEVGGEGDSCEYIPLADVQYLFEKIAGSIAVG